MLNKKIFKMLAASLVVVVLISSNRAFAEESTGEDDVIIEEEEKVDDAAEEEQADESLGESEQADESLEEENNIETFINSGNFSSASTGSIIPLVSNTPLSTTASYFKIYIWIDGNDSSVGNEVGNGTASFSGFISAKTNRFTGILEG